MFYKKNNVKGICSRKHFLECVLWGSVHVYAYTCVWMHVYTHLHVCASRSQKLTSLGVFPKALGHYTLRQGSNELDNLASLLWESQSLTHWYWEGCSTCLAFMWILGIYIWVLTLAQKVFYLLSHLSSPNHRLYWLTIGVFFFHHKANDHDSYEIPSDGHSSHYSTKIRLLILCVCGHVWILVWAQECRGLRRPGHQTPWDRVTGSCQLTDLGARNQTGGPQ